jgi:glucokinase
VLALDIGGTHLRAAVVQPDGTVLHRAEDTTRPWEGPDAVLAACVRLLESVRARLREDEQEGLGGVGISAPGPLDPWNGSLREPPNLGAAFRGVAITDPIARALGLPAVLERDTHVAALAEHAFGAARGLSDFIYITVSTGVGGAIVTGGRLMTGPDGVAGEIGHLPVHLDGPRCGCGGQGHLEALSSGVAIARDGMAAGTEGRSAALSREARGHWPLQAKDVAEAEEAGDPVAAQILDRARRALAAVIVGLVNVFNPERIIVGGGIAEAQGERLLRPAREAVAREAFSVPRARVEIVPAALGEDVSLAGALPLLERRLADQAGERRRAWPTRPEEPSARPSRRATTVRVAAAGR